MSYLPLPPRIILPAIFFWSARLEDSGYSVHLIQRAA